MPFSHHLNSSTTNLALDTTDLVLTGVRDAARLAPIPYLKDAAGLALGIVNLIQVSSLCLGRYHGVVLESTDDGQCSQDVRGNKGAFQRLASDACGLVYAILCRHTTADRSTATDVTKDLLDNLQELLKCVYIYVC
jgi:hypothetical protein